MEDLRCKLKRRRLHLSYIFHLLSSILYFFKGGHTHQAEGIGHDHPESRHQREAKGLKLLVLKMDERGLDIGTWIWMLIKVREGGRQIECILG